MDLFGVAGRRPCLPIVVCCSSRDELDAVSSAVANVPYISLASLVHTYWPFIIFMDLTLFHGLLRMLSSVVNS